MGCELNILRITETIKMKLQVKSHPKIWTLFIDLKSAFDSVNHQILFRKMRELDISESLICTIEWLYNQTAIRANDKDLYIGTGVIQ